MFGGRKETVLAWAKAFYAVFLRYSRKNFHHLIKMCFLNVLIFYRYKKQGRFLGKDQNVMATTCLETQLCLIISGR
jgi:hypothetical protein